MAPFRRGEAEGESLGLAFSYVVEMRAAREGRVVRAIAEDKKDGSPHLSLSASSTIFPTRYSSIASCTRDGCCGPKKPSVASPPARFMMASTPPRPSANSDKSYTLPLMITHTSSFVQWFATSASVPERSVLMDAVPATDDGARAGRAAELPERRGQEPRS